MEISDELISHLESLAHIELDTDEREDCRRDFEKIISYMDTLSALDTDGVEPLTNLSDTVNVLAWQNLLHRHIVLYTRLERLLSSRLHLLRSNHCFYSCTTRKRDVYKRQAKGRDAGRINALLDDIRSSLNTIYHEMQRRDNYVTAEKVKNEFLGHSESHETILSLFQKHNDDVKQLVGISKTIATYRKYEVTRRHLAEFIQSKYNVSDISIKEITPMFITDFELYLRTACKCGYNTTAKFMQFFKRIIIIARNNGILVGDPFARYTIRLEKEDRGYFTAVSYTHLDVYKRQVEYRVDMYLPVVRPLHQL